MPGPTRFGGLGGLGGFFSESYDLLSGKRPILPTNVRIYAQGMLGRKRPITDRDFTEGELTVLQDIARRNRGGESVRYPRNREDFASAQENSVLGPFLENIAEPYVGGEDSAPARANAVDSVLGTLGEFSVRPNAEGYRLQDTYDFHGEWGNEGGSDTIPEQLLDVFRGDADLMRVLEAAAVRSRNLAGGQATGEAGSGGIPVDFTIPYEADNERDQMNKRRFIAEMLRR